MSEIEDVRRQESRRGKRPKDLRVERLKAIRRYLSIGTEREFIEAMGAVGLRPGDDLFSLALEAWHEYRGS